MENLIKASELKKVPDIKELTDHLNAIIKIASECGKKSTRTYGLHGEFGSGDLYNGNTPFVDKVINALKANGFRARIACDMNQFVDIYLYIEWD